MTIKITSQMVAQGSYGLYRIDKRTGQQSSPVITVWHVSRDGKPVGTFLTRAEAREAATAPVRTGDDALREWADRNP